MVGRNLDSNIKSYTVELGDDEVIATIEFKDDTPPQEFKLTPMENRTLIPHNILDLTVRHLTLPESTEKVMAGAQLQAIKEYIARVLL